MFGGLLCLYIAHTFPIPLTTKPPNHKTITTKTLSRSFFNFPQLCSRTLQLYFQFRIITYNFSDISNQRRIDHRLALLKYLRPYLWFTGIGLQFDYVEIVLKLLFLVVLFLVDLFKFFKFEFNLLELGFPAPQAIVFL